MATGTIETTVGELLRTFQGNDFVSNTFFDPEGIMMRADRIRAAEASIDRIGLRVHYDSGPFDINGDNPTPKQIERLQLKDNAEFSHIRADRSNPTQLKKLIDKVDWLFQRNAGDAAFIANVQSFNGKRVSLEVCTDAPALPYLNSQYVDVGNNINKLLIRDSTKVIRDHSAFVLRPDDYFLVVAHGSTRPGDLLFPISGYPGKSFGELEHNPPLTGIGTGTPSWVETWKGKDVSGIPKDIGTIEPDKPVGDYLFTKGQHGQEDPARELIDKVIGIHTKFYGTDSTSLKREADWVFDAVRLYNPDDARLTLLNYKRDKIEGRAGYGISCYDMELGICPEKRIVPFFAGYVRDRQTMVGPRYVTIKGELPPTNSQLGCTFTMKFSGAKHG